MLGDADTVSSTGPASLRHKPAVSSSRPHKYRVMFGRQVFDQDEILFRGKLRHASAEAGAFAGKVVGEGVTVPMREFVVGSAGGRRKTRRSFSTTTSRFPKYSFVYLPA